MSSSRVQVNLASARTEFNPGDLVHLVDEHGEILASGALDSIQRRGWDAYEILLNDETHLIARRGYERTDKYLVHQDVLEHSAPSVHAHLLSIAEIALPGILRTNAMSAEQREVVNTLIESLHHELMSVLTDHPELEARMRMMARAHGYQAVHRDDLEKDRRLAIAKAVRQTY